MKVQASVIIWGDTIAEMWAAAAIAHALSDSGECIELSNPDVLDFPALSDLTKLQPFIDADAECIGLDGSPNFKLSLEEYINDPEHDGNNVVWLVNYNGQKVNISVMK